MLNYSIKYLFLRLNKNSNIPNSNILLIFAEEYNILKQTAATIENDVKIWYNTEKIIPEDVS